MSALNITLKQGKTFTRVYRWGAEPVVFKPVTAITQAAPAVVTAAAHGLPAEWAGSLVSVEGMTEINALNDPPRASDFTRLLTVDINSVSLPNVNSSDFTEYLSGGYLRFFTPVDMAGFTARMKIKSRPGGTEYISLVSPGDIVIDNVAKTITVTISATATAALTFPYGVYDLELVSPGGVVTEIAAGDVELVKEVTA
jgi:hypothetical protein